MKRCGLFLFLLSLLGILCLPQSVNAQATSGFNAIDLANPVNRNHPLAHGLQTWYLGVPGWDGAPSVQDLANGVTGWPALPLNNGAAWAKTSRSGGWTEWQFDGSNDFIGVTTGGTKTFPTSFTITAWVRQETPSTNYRTIIDYNLGAFTFFLKAGKVNFWNGSDHTGATTITASVWNCIGMTYDLVNVRLYLNGLLDGTVAESIGAYPNINNDIEIGCHNGTECFSGAMDNIKLYAGAKTSAEMAEICDNDKQRNLGLLRRIFLPVPLGTPPAVASTGQFFRLMGMGQ